MSVTANLIELNESTGGEQSLLTVEDHIEIVYNSWLVNRDAKIADTREMQENRLRVAADKDFFTHVQRSVGFWCNKITQSARTVAFDKEAASLVPVASPFQLIQSDLESVCWVKIVEPKTWERLRDIWDSPKGGVKGVSRFLSVLCTNAAIDENRKLTVRAAEITGTALDGPLEDDEGETIALIDLVSNDSSDLTIPFGIEDLTQVLDQIEYKVLLDHFVHDGDFTSIADDLNVSKRTAARIAKRALAKATQWVNQLRSGSLEKGRAYQKPLLVGTTWWRPRTTRPDRMAQDDVKSWSPVERVVAEIFICKHDPSAGNLKGSSDMWTIELNGTRSGMCRSCAINYLTSLTAQMERDLMVEHAIWYVGMWPLGGPKDCWK